MNVRWSLAILMGVAGCAAQGGLPASVQGAAANYPPMIITGNVHPTDGHEQPRACASGGTVTTKGGPAFAYTGADRSDPALCLLSIDGQAVKAWYDIWLTDWPGADQAKDALGRVIAGPSGTVAGFDTVMGQGYAYHDLVRNEGIENIALLGHGYRAMKLSHYREGFNGNNYRSVSTVWKDIPTGMLIYGTYQHISGRPEIDDPLIPASISASP